jgi:RecB family exonuclease
MKISLHTSSLATIAHDEIVLPWLHRVARTALLTRRVTAVLVPLQADAYYLKMRALVAGVGLFGVQFFTPGELRDRLNAHLRLRLRLPLREHLHLLLATAAERVHDGAETGVSGSPDTLLKALDLLGNGGWDFAQTGPPRIRPVVAEFRRLLAAASFAHVPDADRALLSATAGAPPLFAQLLVTGFNALHWPLWPLLEAAVRAAEETNVCLVDPRPEGETLDAAWVGTWEQTFEAAAPIASAAVSFPLAETLPLPVSVAEAERRQNAPAAEIIFLVGQDTAEQARAIAAQAVRFAADPACQRLGILFPAAGALSRRVAALLAELEVPHHDGLAHAAPGDLEDAAWPAWLALQENSRLPALLVFLRARPAESFGGLPLVEVEDALSRIWQELLLDDLGLLAGWLEAHPRKRHAAALATALRALPRLPERGALDEYVKRSTEIFRELGWTARAEEMLRLASDWRDAGPLVISRRTWLRWLDEILVSWRAVRSEHGRHPYSRVHLLPYAQAESQTWTHLIAAGLNEGHWPPTLEDSGFLGEEEIAALNARVHALNAQATVQGRQGEGHTAVRMGHTMCLGPAQRRELAVRQFLNTLESATVAIAASAQMYDEAAPERRLNPGNFFSRLYYCARGRAISQETMNALRFETTRWLGTCALSLAPAPDLAVVQQTRGAFDARRERTQPFGAYEFALRTPPTAPLRLSATKWEKAFTSPAHVWLDRLLGVSGRDAQDETPWALATGQWVHRWLRAIATRPDASAFLALPSPEEMLKLVREESSAFHDRVRDLLDAQGRALPVWWLSLWQQARQIAERLARRLGEVEGRTHLATEWTLPETAIPLVSGALHVHGRMDLILTTGPTPTDAWIVDYKTGDRKPLTVKKLREGDGLQLALYALALREHGAAAVGVSVLTPDLELTVPQLALAQLSGEARLWQGLARMQTSGVFGQRGALRDEFSFRRDYPLAMLAIDPEVLDEKWARTHPDFATEEEEFA